MIRNRLLGIAVAVTFVPAGLSPRILGQPGAAQGSRQMPVFEVDPTFFKSLPNGWVTGQGSAVAVDTRDHVWVLHRPRYVRDGRTASPPVLEFDETGRFLQGWGGFADAYDWPDQEHGIYVDHTDHVWITGSARPALAGPGDRVLRSDNMVLKFTNKGQFVLQIGKRDQSTGNNDTQNVYSATDLSVNAATNEVFVADGYINRRVIVFDAGTGAFKRMWGAFGKAPVDPPNMLQNARTPPRPSPATGRGGVAAQPPDLTGPGSQQFVGPVHSAKVSNDGFVYVADRGGHRLQVFTTDGKYVEQVRLESPSGFAISSDSEQRFLYIAQFAPSRIAVLDRQTLEILYQFGTRSETPGNFRGPHELAVDSKGNLYVAEVEPGNRVQKFIFKGLSSTPPTS